MCAALFLRWAMGLEKKFYAHRREEACLRRVLSHLTCGLISIGQRENFFEKKFLRPSLFSVYTNPRSKEHKRIACLGS